MLDFKNIVDNSIIICPSLIKDSLVKEHSHSYFTKRIKFICKEEILSELYPNYDYNAVIDIKNKYDYPLFTSDEIVHNLKYLEYYVGNNERLKQLKNDKDDLDKKGYKNINPLFKQLFVNKTIYVYGYFPIDQELNNLLALLNVKANYLSDDNNYLANKCCYNYLDMETELIEAFNYIYDLLAKGVDLNKIYLYNLDPSYENMFQRFAYYTNLVVEFPNHNQLSKTKFYLDFIKLFQEDDLSIDECFNKIVQSNIDNNNLGSLISLLTKIKPVIENNNLKKEEVIELLNYDAGKIKLKNIHYEKSLKFINYHHYLKDDEYCLILGFNLYNYPKSRQDNDFYTDLEKVELGLNTSVNQNRMEKEGIENFLKKNKNVYISCLQFHHGEKCFPSPILDNLSIKVIDKEVSNNRVGYNNTLIELAAKYDLKRKYNIDSIELNTFTKEEIGYQEFDYRYKKINNYQYDEKNELSYSSLDNYYSCPFKYYLCNVLRIDPFEDTFMTTYGKVAHDYLEAQRNGIQKDFSDYENKFLNAKERTLAHNLFNQLKEVVLINDSFITNSCFKEVEAEKRIKCVLSHDNDQIILVGQLDKIQFNNVNNEVIIVDYKTYDLTFREELVKYGMSLQLPIYSLLLKKGYYNSLNGTNDKKIAGLYIQQVCLNPNNPKNLDYRLRGYSLKDSIYHLDPDLKNNDKSIYLKNVIFVNKHSGFSKNSLVCDDAFFTKISDIAEEKIIEAYGKIKNGEFDIRPLEIDNELKCKYCKHQDICFVKNDAYQIIKSKESKNDDEKVGDSHE